jgi:hypothetical protein
LLIETVPVGDAQADWLKSRTCTRAAILSAQMRAAGASPLGEANLFKRGWDVARLTLCFSHSG